MAAAAPAEGADDSDAKREATDAASESLDKTADNQAGDVEQTPRRSVEESPASDAAPAPAEEALSPQMRKPREKIKRCLAIYYFKPVYAEKHSPWGIMHTMLAYGVDSQIHAGGKSVNAAGWLSWNGPCRGNRMMQVGRDGKLQIRQGPGFQGHPGQFLAMLAQMRIKPDHELRVDGRTFTVNDLIEYEQLQCRRGMELTFPLIALTHYRESDAVWRNQSGQTWTIPDLIREEIREPINGATCGGVHRLMALSYVVRKRLQRGEPMDGPWAEAKAHADKYITLAFELQNPDGSFSTNWFEGRGADPDRDKHLQTTGHILEWIVFSVRRESLQHEKIVAATEHLVDMLLKYPSHPWEIGPRGHALRSLALYDEFVFGGDYGEREQRLAAILKEYGDQRLTRDSAVKVTNGMSDEFEPRGRSRRRLFGF